MRISMGLMLALALTATIGTTANGQSETSPEGCAGAIVAPGDYAAMYPAGDSSAKYWVVVPETYGDDAPVPMVLWLSSGDGDADTHYAGWKPYLDGIDELFVVVGRTGAWHPGAVLELIDQLERDYCVDPRRVHLMGSSSSAITLGKLVCEATDRIASFSGSMGYFNPALHCTPERPVPLIASTGDPDRLQVTQSVAQWAEWNGCEAEPLVEDLGSGVSRHTYLGCEADVVLFDIAGAGHVFIFHECIGLPASRCREYAEFDDLEDTLAFFERYPLPVDRARRRRTRVGKIAAGARRRRTRVGKIAAGARRRRTRA